MTKSHKLAKQSHKVVEKTTKSDKLVKKNTWNCKFKWQISELEQLN